MSDKPSFTPSARPGEAEVADPLEALPRALAGEIRGERLLDRFAALSIASADGRITYVNQEMCELSGYGRDELLGANHRILSSGFHSRGFFELLWSTIAAGRAWNGEVQNRAKSGLRYWVNLTILPIAADEGGTVQGYVGIAHEITERMRAFESLASSEQRLRAAFQGARAGFALLDASDRIELANPALAELLGFTPESLRGHSFVDFGHPDDVRQERGELRRVVQGEQPSYEMQKRWRHRDGHLVPTHTVVWALREGGAVTGVAAMILDETQRRESDERTHVKAALVRLGEMASVIAHEVKNPLAGIGGALRIIGDRMPKDSSERAIMGEIQARLLSLNSTLDELLLFARPIEPNIDRVQIRDVLRDTANLTRKNPDLVHINVEVVGPDVEVAGDRELLKRLFHNLYTNAGQAQRGEGNIRVEVGAKAQVCQVVVHDEGPGLKPELRDKIFEPFFTTKSRGTGLGLPVARRITEAHEGRIYLLPSEAGTRIAVELPLAASVAL